eukprot:3915549-Ditylum_brightwellii.AAC.1
MHRYRSYVCELQGKGYSTSGLDATDFFEEDLKTNWKLSLYAINLTINDVNGIACDLYFLGKQCQCDAAGVIVTKHTGKNFNDTINNISCTDL